MDHFELRTERLRLRRWRPSDLPLFATMNADPRVTEFLPSALDNAQSDFLAERIQQAFEELGFGLWAVEVPQVAPFIGYIGLAVPRFQAHFAPCVEIGWRLAFAHWSHGYAAEGARAVLDYATRARTISEVVSFTSAGNRRSRSVMERIGMTRDSMDDFDHPSLPAGHLLRRHVLYRYRTLTA